MTTSEGLGQLMFCSGSGPKWVDWASKWVLSKRFSDSAVQKVRSYDFLSMWMCFLWSSLVFQFCICFGWHYHGELIDFAPTFETVASGKAPPTYNNLQNQT